MPGEAFALSQLHRVGERYKTFREADEARSNWLEEEFLEGSFDPYDLAQALERTLGIMRRPKDSSPEYLAHSKRVENWQDALNTAASELFVQGKVDRLFERYWSLRKGKGKRRPTNAEAEAEAEELEREREGFLNSWVRGDFKSGMDHFLYVGEEITRTLREPDEARELEYRTAQLALVCSYALDARVWAALAGGRALQLATLADHRRVATSSRWLLTRITALYVDGHDTAVVALARAALESALVHAIPDGVAQAALDTDRDEITLQQRIDVAFRRKLLTKDQRDLAHQIRTRANQVLHGDERLVSAEESLGIVTALANLLKALG
ncbi:MAG: hypothetical protein U0164_23975 [Gemmatimonadaceae bacterium]